MTVCFSSLGKTRLSSPPWISSSFLMIFRILFDVSCIVLPFCLPVIEPALRYWVRAAIAVAVPTSASTRRTKRVKQSASAKSVQRFWDISDTNQIRIRLQIPNQPRRLHSDGMAWWHDGMICSSTCSDPAWQPPAAPVRWNSSPLIRPTLSNILYIAKSLQSEEIRRVSTLYQYSIKSM